MIQKVKRNSSYGHRINLMLILSALSLVTVFGPWSHAQDAIEEAASAESAEEETDEFSKDFFDKLEQNIYKMRDAYSGTRYDQLFLDIRTKTIYCRAKLAANGLSSNNFLKCVDELADVIANKQATIHECLSISNQEEVAAQVVADLEIILARRR